MLELEALVDPIVERSIYREALQEIESSDEKSFEAVVPFYYVWVTNPFTPRVDWFQPVIIIELQEVSALDAMDALPRVRYFHPLFHALYGG